MKKKKKKVKPKKSASRHNLNGSVTYPLMTKGRNNEKENDGNACNTNQF